MIEDKDLPPLPEAPRGFYCPRGHSLDEEAAEWGRQIQREAIDWERARWGDALYEAWRACGCDFTCDWNNLMTAYEAKRRQG